jgi:nicotinamide-nucleotide amidase
VQAEVIAIGSELLLGQIIDTNSAVIARHFASIGLDLFYKTTIGDNLERAVGTLRQALDRSDVVVTTGGIGPTADDITRDAVAAATGRALVFSETLMLQIETYFRSRGLPVSPSNRRQACIPEAALPIENPVGTAPGFIVEQGSRTLITLPGVPREMEYLLVDQVLPYLRGRLDVKSEIRLRVLKVVGLGESRVGELLRDHMEKGRNPTVGTLAHPGQVDVRIAAKAPGAEDAERLIVPVEADIRERLGDVVFGADADTLESEVAARLGRARLAVAEQGTAGLASERLASAEPACLAAGVVLGDGGPPAALGVDLAALPDPAVRAAALAEAVARWAGAEVGAASCLEGPGTAPPLTRAALAVTVHGRTEGREHRLGGDAVSVRIRAATLLLDLIRRALAEPGR